MPVYNKAYALVPYADIFPLLSRVPASLSSRPWVPLQLCLLPQLPSQVHPFLCLLLLHPDVKPIAVMHNKCQIPIRGLTRREGKPIAVLHTKKCSTRGLTPREAKISCTWRDS